MAKKITTADWMNNAMQAKTVIPAFNIFRLAAMEPVVRALRDTNTAGLIEVALLELTKFEIPSFAEVYARYTEVKDDNFVHLHLDHVPVIDEDGKKVDYLGIIREAIDQGFESVMVDGSRLGLEENIEAAGKVVRLAGERGIPVEAELGAVLGHEEGPMLSYEDLFSSGKGFTSLEEAVLFVRKTGIDWLSIAAGNIHGAISKAMRDEKKAEAKLDIEHIRKIHSAVGIPLVLHGGTGIKKDFIKAAVEAGITKINIGTDIRQAYEKGIYVSYERAGQNVYEAVTRIVTEKLEIQGSAAIINR